MSVANSLNIDDSILKTLEKADESMKKLAKTASDTSAQIIKSFQDISTLGVGQFIGKVRDAETALNSLNNKKINPFNMGGVSDASKIIDVINKMLSAYERLNGETKKTTTQKAGLFGGMGSSVKEWEKIQVQIQKNNEQIQRLTQSTKEYELLQSRLQSGKSVVIQAGASKEYQDNLKQIEVLKEQNALLDKKQRAIVETNKVLSAQANMQQSLKQFNSEQTSLPEQRKNEELKRMNDYYRNLERSSKKAAQTSADEMEKAAKREAAAIDKIMRQRSKLYQQQNIKKNTTFQGALNFSDEAKTINRRTKAIQYLTEARNKLSQSDDQYEQKVKALNRAIQQQKKEIERLTGRTNELRKSHSNFLDTAGQLQRRLALVFSVSQISGYISKLIQVRGEFELQQKSLEVLLQNKDEADKLWQQTIDLAVKSPFRVKQLVTYTRQLAAYRIETEKLHDTTRRLSDVSAGLGVDMQRIILAFGQVRAANFLRGTELRQFTEAGIPMLDELAKYFTELEGRAISAGDVFEMISKRMVSFSDVEEVFHRMTNAGGVFYKMQDEQSKTLSGLISNLHDSIDLMLNDIGKANDGILKGSINTMRQFFDNWREVAYTLEKVVIAYSLYKIANAAFILGSKNAATTTLWWNNALKAKIGTTMADIQTMTLQEASLYGVSKGQYAAGKATVFFQGAVRGVGLALKMAAPFLLAFIAIEIVRYFTAASRAAAELQRELEEIYQSDYTNFKKQTDTLKDLVERLKNVTKGSQEHKDIISRLNSSYGEYLGNLNEETATYENLAASIDKTIMALSQKAKAQTLEKAIAKSFEKTNKEIMSLQEDITNGMKRLVRESGGALLVPQEQEINDFFNLFEKRTKEAGELLNRSDINKILSEYYGENVMITSDINFSHFVSLGEQILEQKQQEEKVQRQINNLYGEGIYSTQKAREEFQKLEEDKAKALQNEKTRIGRQKIENQFEMARIDLQVKYEGLDKNIADYRKSLAKGISATVEDINRQIIESIPELGEDVADKIFIDQTTAATGLESIAESTAQAYKGQLELIKQQNALKDAGTVYDQKLLANAERMAKGYYTRLKFMGRLDLLKKSSTESESKELQLLNRQLSAIKDASSAFKSLSDIYGEEEAKKKVESSFKNLFKELNISDITSDMDFDEIGVIRVLKQLPNIAGERGAQAIEKIKAEFNSEIDVNLRIGRVKTIEEQISELFSGYELSIELDKMNIPEDLAQSLFNIDATSLPALKEQVKFFEDELIALGDKGVEIWNKSQKKIEEVEKNEQLERLKKYTQYLVKGQSERVKIKMEEIRQLSKLEELGFSEEQKSQIRKGIQDETKEKLSKAEWEAFKDTDIYIQMFEDLGIVSNKVLSDLKNKLINMRGSLSDLDPRSLKDIISQIEKINRLQTERNPFDNLKDSIKSGIDAIKRLNKEQEAYYNAQKEQDFTQSEIDSIMIANERKKAEIESAKAAMLSLDTTEEQSAMYNKIIQDNKQSIAQNNKLLRTLQAQLIVQEKATEEAAKRLGITKEEVVAFNNSANQIGGWGSAATNAITEVTNMLTNWGVEMSDVASGILDGFGQMFGSLEQLDITKPFSILKSATGILAGFGNIFASIFGFGNHDRRAEKKIQSYTKYVEQLEKAYERLEKQISDAYSIDSLQKSGKDALNNLTAQIESYEKMIEAENSKKKTDDDRVKEWKNEIEALEKLKAEKEKELVSTATDGILDDVRSAAREFVDAWVDAFNETGDGLIGLKDNFKQNMLEMVKQQAAMLISQSYIERWKKQLEQYINPEDLELTTDEAGKWVNAVTESLPQLNEALEKYFTAMQQAGVDVSGGTSGELSGLSKGIQAVSESTAQIIEAYLNSVRFYVADSNTKLTMIANKIIGSDETTNPMLSELRSQTELIRSIRDMFSSVIRGGHPTYGGAFLKVSL